MIAARVSPTRRGIPPTSQGPQVLHRQSSYLLIVQLSRFMKASIHVANGDGLPRGQHLAAHAASRPEACGHHHVAERLRVAQVAGTWLRGRQRDRRGVGARSLVRGVPSGGGAFDRTRPLGRGPCQRDRGAPRGGYTAARSSGHAGNAQGPRRARRPRQTTSSYGKPRWPACRSSRHSGSASPRRGLPGLIAWPAAEPAPIWTIRWPSRR